MSNNNGSKAAVAPEYRDEPRSDDTSDHESRPDGQASNSHPIHAALQPQMPQRFPVPQAQVQPPDTPRPAVPRAGDPNPRVGSMHNLAPQLKGPAFPAHRGPIYFPSELVTRPHRSQTMTEPDTSSPLPGSKSLQKGYPQQDWEEIIGSNADKEKQNDGSAKFGPSEKPKLKGYYRPKGSPLLVPKRVNPSQPHKRPDFVPSKVSPIPEDPAAKQQARPSLLQSPGLTRTATINDPVVDSTLFPGSPAQDQQVSPSQGEPPVLRDADLDVIMSDAPQDDASIPFPPTPTLASAPAAGLAPNEEDILMEDATEFVPTQPAQSPDGDLIMQDPFEPVWREAFSDFSSRGQSAPLGLPVVARPQTPPFTSSSSSRFAAPATPGHSSSGVVRMQTDPPSPGDATPMVDVQTLPIARKRRIDQVDDAELPEGARGDLVDVEMRDAEDEDEKVQMVEEAPSAGVGFVPGTFPASPGRDVPMQDGEHVPPSQSTFTFRAPTALGQIGRGFKKVWSAAARGMCRIFQSVKRRAVEAYKSSTSSRLRRRRAASASASPRRSRCLSPEQRHEEKARRLRASMPRRSRGDTPPLAAAEAALARSDEPMLDVSGRLQTGPKSPRRTSPSKPRRHSPKAEQLARVNKTRKAASRLAKTQARLAVRASTQLSPKERRRREAIQKELMRQWAMPVVGEWPQEEDVRTGIPVDEPCVESTQEPTRQSQQAPTEPPAETPSEEPYEGFMHSPEGRAPSAPTDWMAAETSPSSRRPISSTVTTDADIDAGERQEESVGQEQVRDEGQIRRSLRTNAGPLIRPLPETWESRLQTAMACPESRQLATTLRGDPLTRRDLATCSTPMAWLNDEIINGYLDIVVDHARRKAGNSGRHDQPKYHTFNSFFYSNLRDKGYESVRRWASRAKIGGAALLNVNTVFVPVHDHSHWTLMVVKPAARTIEHFDSLGSPSRSHAARIKTWLRGELGDLFKEDEWRILQSTSPQQNNGSDCGVFLLTTAKLVALDLPLRYGARDITDIRKRIAAELLNGGFDGDFDPELEFQTKPML